MVKDCDGGSKFQRTEKSPTSEQLRGDLVTDGDLVIDTDLVIEVILYLRSPRPMKCLRLGREEGNREDATHPSWFVLALATSSASCTGS